MNELVKVNGQIGTYNKIRINRCIYCVILSFICITINSKFSFLYKFHDVDDVHCFITVARCMLRGDVLYKDIYEHKGPYHYFLYYLGLSVNDRSFIGLWIIEIILFSVFLYFVLKIFKEYIKSDLLCYVLTAVTGVASTVKRSFCAGGQCEEFALPFLTIAIYYIITENSDYKQGKDPEQNAEPKKRNILSVLKVPIIMGICFSVIFWSKYTLTGAFVGYALGILISGLINKDIKYITRNVLGFLLGALLGSLPVIVYFAVNKAFYDLWEVYFYNLIFKYSHTDLGTNGIINNLLSTVRPWIVVAVIGTVIAPAKMLKKEGKIILVLMVTFGLIGISTGKMWGYVYESRYAFFVLMITGIVWSVMRILSFEKIRSILNNIARKFTNRLKEEIKEKPDLKKKLTAVFVTNKRKTYVVGIIVLLLYTCYFSYTVSEFVSYIDYDKDDYVRVQMSRIILEKVPEDPVILCFTSLDPGLYYLTGTYPPDKYFCRYNLFTPQELGYYEKYLKTGIADYVVSYKPVDDLSEYGYQLVFEREDVYIVYTSGDNYDFYLYAREDLV